jgi:hypothetical protein
MVAERTVLVAGAGGLVGRAVIEHYLAQGSAKVIALSRHPPVPETGAAHIAVDLTDPASCETRLGGLGTITHIVYAALFEKPDLTQGWLDEDQIATNLAMLTHLIEAIEPNNPGLRHITRLQGAKAYGVHLGQISVPARESAPRHIPSQFLLGAGGFPRRATGGKNLGMDDFPPAGGVRLRRRQHDEHDRGGGRLCRDQPRTRPAADLSRNREPGNRGDRCTPARASD